MSLTAMIFSFTQTILLRCGDVESMFSWTLSLKYQDAPPKMAHKTPLCLLSPPRHCRHTTVLLSLLFMLPTHRRHAPNVRTLTLNMPKEYRTQEKLASELWSAA
jgi:hypothetical protein